MWFIRVWTNHLWFKFGRGDMDDNWISCPSGWDSCLHFVHILTLSWTKIGLAAPIMLSKQTVFSFYFYWSHKQSISFKHSWIVFKSISGWKVIVFIKPTKILLLAWGWGGIVHPYKLAALIFNPENSIFIQKCSCMNLKVERTSFQNCLIYQSLYL